MKIRYVVLNAYGMGGTTRTVVNQANALCADHDIEIASIYRHRETPAFAIDPRIRLVPLTELRSDGTCRTRPQTHRTLLVQKALRFPNPLPHRHDYRFRRWRPTVDIRLVRYFRAAADGILVTTRPGLNLLSARAASPRLIRVGQDHMNLESYKPALRRAIARAYPRLDAVTVLTEHDYTVYQHALAGSGVRLERIPNGIPPPRLPPAPLEAKVLVAAGRLAEQKGFDLLLDAFHTVVAQHPDWQLWIFGVGENRPALAAQLERLGLTGRAHLKGGTEHLDERFAESSIFVLSSRLEGLPMVLLEAMTAGLPVVAFNCPTGPGEVITHERSGLLVPAQDVPALAAGICALIENPRLRRAMGAAAHEDAARFSIATVRRQWEELFTELTARTSVR